MTNDTSNPSPHDSVGFPFERIGTNFQTQRSVFRGVGNQRITKQLFFDMWIMLPVEQRTCRPLFTLHEDRPGFVNFRKAYVMDGDPTGYTTANRLLESYAHWKMLLKCPWFVEAKVEWDEELDARLKSDGMAYLRSVLADPEVKQATRLVAAKYLAGLEHRKGQAGSAKAGRGRPSTAEVEGELKRQAASVSDISADLERIRNRS